MSEKEIERLAYLDKLSKSSELQYIEYQLCKNDPYYWLTHWAKTTDSHYLEWEDPVKTFPEKEYIRIFVDEWRNNTILAIPKSRQMMISWLCVAIYLWDTQFHKARFTCFQSKREDDADELVKRLKHIWDNEPAFLKRYYNEDGTYIELKANPTSRGNHLYCKFELPAIGSRVLGIPQWGNIVRMQTLSWMLSDEAAFQEEMDDAYTALKPTLSGWGKLTMVSTPESGTFFEAAVFDELVME